MSNVTANSTKHFSSNGEGGYLNGVAVLGTDISLLILQIMLITLISRGLAFCLKYLKQPRVISEVIAGIVLGPSVLGHIPGFSATVFPPARLSLLGIVANVGLVLFLFIIGLELDLSYFKKNVKKSILISVFGMAVPFCLGCAVSLFLYDYFLSKLNPAPGLASVILFLGVALSITAFPVLARILIETKMLDTKLGVTVISAAAVDDSAAWCLLALVIAIIASKTLLNALYIFLMLLAFLVVMGGVFFLFQRMKVPKNPSQNYIVGALMICFAAAWLTDFIGVHPIFGAFIAGAIMPRKNGFSVKIIEKIEDINSFILLPLYFANSGLKTDIGLLNSGLAWAAVFLVILAACVGKIVGATGASLLLRMHWREALAVGLLMNAKGLVELIVLNIGLNAGVIDAQIFTVMVLMALITTFMTVPLLYLVYPPHMRQHGEISKKSHQKDMEKGLQTIFLGIPPVPKVPVPAKVLADVFSTSKNALAKNFKVFSTRFIVVDDRESSVAIATRAAVGPKGQRSVELNKLESLKLPNIEVVSQNLVSTPENFCSDIAATLDQGKFSMMILPWDSSESENEEFQYNQLLSEVLNTSPVQTIVYGSSNVAKNGSVMVLFGGGEDDCAALEFTLNFCSEIHIFVCKKNFLKKNEKSSDSSSGSQELPVKSSWNEKEKKLMEKANLLAKSENTVTITQVNLSLLELVENLDKKIAGTSSGISFVVVGRNSTKGIGKAAQKILKENWADVLVVSSAIKISDKIQVSESEQNPSGHSQKSTKEEKSHKKEEASQDDSSVIV